MTYIYLIAYFFITCLSLKVFREAYVRDDNIHGFIGFYLLILAIIPAANFITLIVSSVILSFYIDFKNPFDYMTRKILRIKSEDLKL